LVYLVGVWVLVGVDCGARGVYCGIECVGEFFDWVEVIVGVMIVGDYDCCFG